MRGLDEDFGSRSRQANTHLRGAEGGGWGWCAWMKGLRLQSRQANTHLREAAQRRHRRHGRLGGAPVRRRGVRRRKPGGMKHLPLALALPLAVVVAVVGGADGVSERRRA